MLNLVEKSFPIVSIETSGDQKTFFFNVGAVNFKPGQFYLLNFRNSQKPFSVSHYTDGIIGFTILRRGNTTVTMLDKAQTGEYVGLTGPLGNYFDTESYQNFLLIGGGVGSAPIYALSTSLSRSGKKNHVLLGARNNELHSFTKSLTQYPSTQVTYYTDDNSGENQGFVTDGIENILTNNTIDTVCICGPEKMMVKAASIVESLTLIPIQISMERYMKCGIGICGSCVLDDIGLRVCADGPVFEYSVLKKSAEFGKYHRNSGGLVEYF